MISAWTKAPGEEAFSRILAVTGTPAKLVMPGSWDPAT